MSLKCFHTVTLVKVIAAVSGVSLALMLTQWFSVSHPAAIQTLPDKIIEHQDHSHQPTTSTSWQKRREVAMATSSHKKVLLFCYMRGGSTFFSQNFMRHEDVVFWYEPIGAFYSSYYGTNPWILPQNLYWVNTSTISRRPTPKLEGEALTRYNHNLLSCNTNQLPVELLTHLGVSMAKMTDLWGCIMAHSNNTSFVSCHNLVHLTCNQLKSAIMHNCSSQLQKANEIVSLETLIERRETERDKEDQFSQYARCRTKYYRENVSPCVHILENMCRNRKLVAYKGLRLSMKQTQQFLEYDPDMFVLYLVRDPRSIVASRFQLNLRFNRDPVIEAKYLCKKMLNDLKEYKLISKLYKGALKLVKYEDLIKNPKDIVSEVFRFLDHSVSSTSKVGYLQAADAIEAQATKWKRQFDAKIQQDMTDVCWDVLIELDYL